MGKQLIVIVIEEDETIDRRTIAETFSKGDVYVVTQGVERLVASLSKIKEDE